MHSSIERLVERFVSTQRGYLPTLADPILSGDRSGTTSIASVMNASRTGQSLQITAPSPNATLSRSATQQHLTSPRPFPEQNTQMITSPFHDLVHAQSRHHSQRQATARPSSTPPAVRILHPCPGPPRICPYLHSSPCLSHHTHHFHQTHSDPSAAVPWAAALSPCSL